MLKEFEELSFEILFKGKSYGKFSNQQLAEAFKQNLPQEVREGAVITPVDASGKQFLLG